MPQPGSGSRSVSLTTLKGGTLELPATLSPRSMTAAPCASRMKRPSACSGPAARATRGTASRSASAAAARRPLMAASYDARGGVATAGPLSGLLLEVLLLAEILGERPHLAGPQRAETDAGALALDPAY